MMWRAVVLVALAAAISIGMLAMHSAASPVSDADRAMTTEHSTVIVEPNQAADVSLGDCAGCPKNMAMTVMWCVLALLTATLVLLLAPRSTRLRRRRLRRLRPPPPSHYRLVWYLASFDGGDGFAPLAGAPSLVTIASDPTRLAGLVGVDPDGRLWIGFATPNADWTPASSVTGAPAAITVSSDGTMAVADESGVNITRDEGATWTTVISAF